MRDKFFCIKIENKKEIKMESIKKILIGFFIVFVAFMLFLPSDLSAQNSGYANLTRGWDLFGDPISSGSVRWETTYRGVIVQFELKGAKPNHSYTVGVHLFNPYNKASMPENRSFGGYLVGDGSVISREGNTAYTIAWDFGQIYTNGRGDGFARFDLSVPSGTYFCQFTVRIGGEGTCLPFKGIFHGCGVVYRTGNRFAESFETITIGGSTMGQETGRQYTAQPFEPTQPYGRGYTSPPVSIQPSFPEQPQAQQFQPVQPVSPPPPPPPLRQDEDEFTKTYRRVDEYIRK